VEDRISQHGTLHSNLDCRGRSRDQLVVRNLHVEVVGDDVGDRSPRETDLGRLLLEEAYVCCRPDRGEEIQVSLLDTEGGEVVLGNAHDSHTYKGREEVPREGPGEQEEHNGKEYVEVEDRKGCSSCSVQSL